MKFIKKLIVLTGKAGKGTLTLEQVSCGISYKLSTFNLVQAESRDLLLIFGSEIYVDKVKDGKAQGVLSVVPVAPLHCAVMLGGKVEVYGADCQNRMPVFEIEQAYAVKKFGGKSCSSSNINPVVAFEQEGKNDVPKQINDGLVESEPCDKNTDEKDITRDGRVEIQNYFLEIVEPPSKVTESESIGCDSESELSSSESASSQGDDSRLSHNEGVLEPTQEKFIYQDDAIANDDYFEIERKNLRCQSSQTANPQQRVCESKEDCADKEAEKNMPEEPLTVKNQGRKVSGIYDKEIFEREKSTIMKRRLKPVQNGANVSESCGDTVDEEVAATCDYQPRKASFYEKNKMDLEQLFVKYSRFETLEQLIPGSRWVKIDYDSGRYYVVGMTADYICYGVPAKYSPVPPKEFAGYCSWMPKSSTNPSGEGFWIIYQDLASGKTLRN